MADGIWDSIWRSISTEWRVVKRAWRFFAAAQVVVAVGVWFILNWYFSGRIETQTTTIESQLALIESLKAAGESSGPAPQRHLTEPQKDCLSANLKPYLKEFSTLAGAFGKPNLVIAVVAGEEPEIYENDFLKELKSIGFSTIGLGDVIPDNDNDKGIIVGIVDPNNPSPAALKFENALLSCGFVITTEKSGLFEGTHGIDFDLFIAGRSDGS